MREFKIFCTMFIYVWCLHVFVINSAISFCLISTAIFLVIKYLKQKTIVKKCNQATKMALHAQREYFINSLNHDLRIPIIAQLRALEFIDRETLGQLNLTQKEMIKQTEQSCRCILNLISLMINTYNIENSSYKLIYDRFNLYETLLSCFEELTQNASEKNITFEYSGIDKGLSLFADKDDIKKVIKNLLMSSIDYANSGAVISVKVKNFNKKLQLSVSIKEEQNKNIINNYDSRFNAIGQSIRFHFCKKIIELHKGHILQNNKHSKAFVFELPISA